MKALRRLEEQNYQPSPGTFNQARLELDLSQVRMAEALGCSRRHVQKIEAGEYQASKVLGLALAYLLITQ